jgi:hypothetical protein
MIRNPKLAPIIWVPLLLLAIACGFYVMDSPRRSLEASRDWLSRHQEEWHTIKNSNPALKRVDLNISSEGRGTVSATGFTYDQNAIVEVNRFVDANEPPNQKFKNRIRLVSKSDFYEMNEMMSRQE